MVMNVLFLLIGKPGFDSCSSEFAAHVFNDVNDRGAVDGIKLKTSQLKMFNIFQFFSGIFKPSSC